MAESCPRDTNKDVLFIKEFLEHNSTKNVEVSARQTETSSTEAAFSASPATIGALISKTAKVTEDCWGLSIIVRILLSLCNKAESS